MSRGGDEKVEAPAERKGPIRELVRDVRDAVLPDPADGPEVLPKKNRPLLNVLKVNPLDRGDKDEQVEGNAVGDEGGTAVKHRPGLGKTPVRDLVKRITSGFDRDDDESESETEAKPE